MDEKEGYSTTIGVVDGMAWFEDGTSVDNVTVELIMAAPDLLAALEDMIDACEHWDDQDDPVLIAAREAIAKAKGGE